jgi:histidine triad (HIT) family protein
MITDIFCKIIKKELPAEIIMEGKDWIAVNDIHPQAPIHILIISKKHIDIPEITDSDTKMVGNLIAAANKIAKKLKLERGFRLIINRGQDGGQLVPHFHIHLLGGKRLGAKIVQDPKE